MLSHMPQLPGIRRFLKSLRSLVAIPRRSSPGLSGCVRFSGKIRSAATARSAESLESRLLLTLNVGLSSGNLLVQETSAGVDDLTIGFDSATQEYTFHDPTSILSTNINSASGNGSNTIRVPISRVSGDSIQILVGAGADKVTVANNFAPGSSRSLVIDTGAGSDIVSWNSDSTLASISVTSEVTEIAAATVKSTTTQTWNTTISSLNAVDLQGSGISLRDVQAGSYPFTVTDAGSVSISGKLTATNIAAISITGRNGITVAAGSDISTNQGSITLNAPLHLGTAGNVSGISIKDAIVRTSGGSITLTARTTAAASGNAAVQLEGAQLSTTGSGVIVIDGTAASNAAAPGLRILNGAQRSSLITHNGQLSLTGISGSSGSYVGTSLAGALIRSTGSGQITLSGESRSSETGMLIDNGCDIEANGTGSVSLGGVGTTEPQATITFDGLSGTKASPWLEKGLRFESDSAFDGGFPHGMVGSTAATGFVDVTSTDGKPFNVFSMDVSENNGSIKSRTIHFTGLLATGGTVEQSITTNSTFGREQIQLSGFTNLSKLRFTFDSTTWDDINFSHVNDRQMVIGNATIRAASGNVLFSSDRIRLPGTLTADIGGSVNWSSELTGPGSLRKIGAGTLTISGATSYAGGTQVENGLLQISGSVVSPVSVNNQGRLSGSGTLHASLDVHSGGLLEPGGIPGILSTGPLAIQQGSTLSLELGGTLPGNTSGNHDQISVRGSTTLAGNLSLTLTGGYQPAAGDTLVLITNDGTDAISGSFIGLAENAEFTLDGTTWRISYVGGSGNDVVITCIGQQFEVSNLNASGNGSLYQAILNANAAAGLNVIVFSVAGLIEIATSHILPVITDPILIDGFSAPGFGSSPVIEISGVSAGLNSGLVFGSGSAGSTLRGLSIVRFAKAGVELRATDVSVVGSWIGVTRGGAAAGNGTSGSSSATGVLVNAANARIGGELAADANVISSNFGTGIIINGGSNAVIRGNRIGTNAAGTAALANQSDGILVADSQGVTIGGSTVAARNLISGNGGNGIRVTGSQSGGLKVAGNFIGTSLIGDAAIRNAAFGINVAGARNIILGTDSDGIHDNLEGNLISGNDAGGIRISAEGGAAYSSSDFLVIAGNRIGTSADGNSSVRNRSAGILLTDGARGVLVGTNGDGIGDEAERNLISGNEYFGVRITGSSTQQNTIAGNLIGTNAGGTARLGNWDAGISISDGAHHNLIGTNNTADGHNAAESNLILGDQRLIWIHGGFDNVIAGNSLGVNKAGTQQFYATHAIVITGGSQRNRVGTDGVGANNDRERNIIAGDSHGRIVVSDSNTNDNRISGNDIGLTPSGTSSFGFCIQGIIVSGGAKRTLIGTDGDGNGDLDERNILVGHGTAIEVAGEGTSDTVIAGNYLGLSASGTERLGNITAVNVFGRASKTRIGTDGSNDAFNIHERNVIAGSGTGPGIMLSRTTDVVIAGNYIGLNAAGTVGMFTTYGITATDHVLNLRIGTNGDGRADDLEGNVVSGNQFGIRISNWSSMDLSTADQVIAGSIPATFLTGSAPQADFVSSATPLTGNWNWNHTLPGGGSNHYTFRATGTLNVATAGEYTFALTSEQGGRLKINGASVATDLGEHSGVGTVYATVNLTAGTHQLEWTGFEDRGGAGFEVSVAVGARQGGTVSEAEGWKVLGAPQPHAGIRLDGELAVTVWYIDALQTNTVIAGNRIGVAADGLTRLANGIDGITVDTNGTRIGGSLPAERNIISGNGGAGLVIPGWGRENSGILVAGNYIGVAADGLTDVGNSGPGVVVHASNVVIGGPRTSDGAMVSGPGNVISGNKLEGIRITGSQNQVSGNRIGTNRSGTAARGLPSMQAG